MCPFFFKKTKQIYEQSLKMIYRRMRVMEVVPPPGGAVDASKIEVYHHRESQSHLVYLLQFLVCSYFHLYEFAYSGYLQ